MPVPAIVVAMALVAATPVRAEWRIPKAITVRHPGAAAGPNSSPLSYPDVVGFHRRVRILVDGLAGADLGTWRRGYFADGDPGKYLPLHAMARLMKNPADPESRTYMNDNRSYNEHYHFAALNWSRFLPIFGDVLTADTKRRLSSAAARYTRYLNPGGTENHKTMWVTSAAVLPHYLEGGRLAHAGKETALKRARLLLKEYVKGLYRAGQGEWDSSTYLMFVVHGLLNVYDFSKDEECRLLAQAGLDLLVASYALKYTDGYYCAPGQRGFASGYVESVADQTGWLWWGGSKELTSEDVREFRHALHAATSSWRPNSVLTNIARRRVAAMPFEQFDSKPNYWYGLGRTPLANQYRESLYVTRYYTLGSLWNGYGGQMARLQMVVSGRDGGISFTGGHPYRYKYADGNGRYDQSAQWGSSYISMSAIPPDEPHAYSFFSIPEGATDPETSGGWTVMRASAAFVGLHPLASPPVVGKSDLTNKLKEENQERVASGKPATHEEIRILRFNGRKTGFILQTADMDSYADLDAFKNALARTTVDTSSFSRNMEVSYTSISNDAIRMRYVPKGQQAEVSINGEVVDYSAWPIFSGPYVYLSDSVLRVTDGRNGYMVDFSGDTPKYAPWPSE
jgi:hypothetical protein